MAQLAEDVAGGSVNLVTSRILESSSAERRRATARVWGTVWLGRLIVAFALVIFAALSFYQYRLPGLYYDEAFDVVPAMQLLKGQDVDLARGTGIHLFGRDFPVMIGDYWGVVSTYAVLPLFAIFGVGVFPIRLWSIGAGLVAILLTYLVGRRHFSEPVGVIAALLLAVFPSFIFWSRTGIYVISHIVAVTLGIILAFGTWKKTGKHRWLLLAGWLTGIGLATKLLFLWFLIAIPAAWVVLVLADLLGERPPSWAMRGLIQDAWGRLQADVALRSWRDPLVALVGFLVGAFPLIYYNVATQGSYRVLRANLFSTERGVDNFALLTNIRTELDSLKVLLDGGYFWYYGGIYTNPLYPWVAGIATAGLLLLVHRVPEFAGYRRVTVFLLAFVVVTFFLSCFSVSILGPTHLLIMLPIPQLFIAAFGMLGARWLRERVRFSGHARRFVPIACVGLLLVPLIARDLWVDRRYHQTLAETGGHSAFSSAIYTLADHLDDTGQSEVYALDWGLKYPVMILTQGRVTPLEVFGATFEPGPDFEAALRSALEDTDPIFIANTEESVAYPRLGEFRRIASETGHEVVLERTIAELSGRPIYYVFRVR